MKKHLFISLLIIITALILNTGMLAAQNRSKPITVTGQVVDSLSGDPVAYATVMVADLEMKPVKPIWTVNFQ